MRKKYYHAATPETMKKIIADGVVKRGWDERSIETVSGIRKETDRVDSRTPERIA